MGIDNLGIYILLALIFAILIIRNIILQKYKLLGYLVFVLTCLSWVILIRYAILPLFITQEYCPNSFTALFIPFYSAFKFFGENIGQTIKYFGLYFVFTISIGIGSVLLYSGRRKFPISPLIGLVMLSALRLIKGLFDGAEVFDLGEVIIMFAGCAVGCLITKPIRNYFKDKFVKEEL